MFKVPVVGLTPEAKIVLSKHLIQVHLGILSLSNAANMASHFLTKFIT